MTLMNQTIPFKTATSISLGSNVKGTIRTVGDLDYFKFTVGQAGSLEVQVSNIDPELRVQALIYDANPGTGGQ